MKRPDQLKLLFCHSASEEGFTIVEMLVGLCIAALMAALMATTLGQLRPIRDTTERIAAETELAAAGAYLEGLISDARNLALIDSDIDRKIVFSGSSQSLRFVAATRVGSDRTSLRDIKISVSAVSDSLELRQTNAARRIFTRPPGETFTVLTDLRSVRFEFLDPSAPLGSDRWQDEWPTERLLPRAVKISIEALRSGRSARLERVIPIPAGIESAAANAGEDAKFSSGY